MNVQCGKVNALHESLKVSKAFHKAMNSVFSLLSFNPISGDSGLQALQNNFTIKTHDKSKH